jgi:hypothetical protein
VQSELLEAAEPRKGSEVSLCAEPIRPGPQESVHE